MMRGSRVDDIVLYSDEIMFVEPQQIAFVWLKAMNVSQRNWPVRCSVNLMFLNKDKSVRQKPGPRMAPGRSVVSVICVVGGATQMTETTERPGAIRGPGFWRTDLSLFKRPEEHTTE